MRFLLLPTLLLLTITSFAQQVENVVATQQGATVLVTYDIKDQSNRPYYVKLLMSRNGGQSFSKELKFVSGDVRNTKAGINKNISWDAARELSYYDGNAVFRVVATPKTAFLPEPIENKAGKIELISVKGSGSRVVVDFILTPYYDSSYSFRDLQTIIFDSNGNESKYTSTKIGNVSDGSKKLLSGIPINSQIIFNSSDQNSTILPFLNIQVNTFNSFEFRNVPIAR